MNESFIVYKDSAILNRLRISRNSCLDCDAYFTYILNVKQL